MKHLVLRIPVTTIAFVTSLLLVPVAGLAQAAPSQATVELPKSDSSLQTTAQEKSVVLSPFVVQTSSDVGYESTNTLGGTGLNSKITDLGSSISVVTNKFLKDTGATDFKQFLIYQANIEVKGFGGNTSGATPTLGNITNEPTLSNSDASIGTRVRGLADATLARNYYRTVLPMDSYNTERVDINRGSNALLFGVGSPAGIINTSTKTADINKTFGSAEITGGSYGSFRETVDLNAAVGGQLAFRFAQVHDDEKYEQKFAYRDSGRRYLTGTWDIKPFRNRGIFTSTTISANFEQGAYTSNNPRVLTPVDKLSSWFTSTLPSVLTAAGAAGKATYNPTAGPFNTFTPATGNATLAVIANVNRSPTFFFQNQYASAPQWNIPTNSAGQNVLGGPLVSNNVYFPSTGLTGTAVGAGTAELTRVLQNYSITNSQFYTAQNLSNPSIFNFFKNTLEGPNEQAISNLRAAAASFQQLLFKGKAGVELSIDRQHWDESQQSLLSETQPYIAIDPNTKMWTGEVNPDFGRPFVSTSGTARYTSQDIQTKRAKVYYSLDFQDELNNSLLGGILGKHVFSVLDQKETLTQDNRTGGSPFYTPDTWTNGNDQSRAAAQSKQIVTWVYLGPSVYNLNSPSGINLQGLQQNLLNFQNQVNGKGVVLSRVQAPSAAAATQAAYNPYYTALTVDREDRLVDHTATTGTLSASTLDGRAFAVQSNWLWDHFVSTIGWRREESSVVTVNAAADPSGQGFVLVNSPSYSIYNPTVAPLDFGKTLKAWSLVAKTPEAWLRHVPLVTALNVYYDSSEDFSPPATRQVDAFGTAIVPPGGKTTERGVYVEALDGMFSARVNFFTTTQKGSINSTVGNIANSIMSLHVQVYNLVQSGLIANGGNGFPVNYVAPPQELINLYHFQVNNGAASVTNPGVTDTSDFVTKGKELELGFRPLKGLSFLANVAEQESITSDTGVQMGRLIFDTPTATGKPLSQEWQSDWAFQVPINAGAINAVGSHSNINILGVAFQTNVLNVYNSAVSQDGAVATNLRKWRANFVTNYEFQNHLLKGFGIGGAVRWQDKIAIGYPVITSNGISVSDVAHPFYGPTDTQFDGWISYHTNILKDKIGIKVQLNVHNMFTNDKLIPVQANPDGSIAVWSIAESRRFTVSTTFSF